MASPHYIFSFCCYVVCFSGSVLLRKAGRKGGREARTEGGGQGERERERERASACAKKTPQIQTKFLGSTVVRTVQERGDAATLRHAHLALLGCAALLHRYGTKMKSKCVDGGLGRACSQGSHKLACSRLQRKAMKATNEAL